MLASFTHFTDKKKCSSWRTAEKYCKIFWKEDRRLWVNWQLSYGQSTFSLAFNKTCVAAVVLKDNIKFFKLQPVRNSKRSQKWCCSNSGAVSQLPCVPSLSGAIGRQDIFQNTLLRFVVELRYLYWYFLFVCQLLPFSALHRKKW